MLKPYDFTETEHSAALESTLCGFVDSVCKKIHLEVLILKVNVYKESLNSRVWLLAL